MIISIILGIILLGLFYWLVSLIPLPEPFPTIVRVLFIILAVLYILDALGFYHTGVSLPFPR